MQSEPETPDPTHMKSEPFFSSKLMCQVPSQMVLHHGALGELGAAGGLHGALHCCLLHRSHVQ